MNSGKVFENDWKHSINESEIYYLRLKDSPSSFGQDSSKIRFTANNPYDHFCFYKFRLFPLELKHTKGTSFSIQFTKKEKQKMIKLNQIEGLQKSAKHEGVLAGFVFNIYNEKKDSNHTYWLDIVDFTRFFIETEKKSINENDIINYGGVEVKTNKKKIHYNYSVQDLFDELINNQQEETWAERQKRLLSLLQK